MPSDLAIDHKERLSGTKPPYAQHVVIRTGKSDWSKKIEDEPDGVGGGVNFARELKKLVGRGGKFHDVRMYLCYVFGSATGGSWGEWVWVWVIESAELIRDTHI